MLVAVLIFSTMHLWMVVIDEGNEVVQGIANEMPVESGRVIINYPPDLVDNTELPAFIYPDTEITFIINYSDKDDDEGSVTLYIDNESHVMEVIDPYFVYDWQTGVEFTYTWQPTAGEHSYYYYAEDERGADSTLDNGTELYKLKCRERTQGMIYGKVSDIVTGENITGAKAIIYSVENNDSGDNKGEQQYWNTSTDIDGHYSKVLLFGTYFIYFNATGYNDSNVFEFVLDMTAYEVERYFSLSEWIPIASDETGELSGHVYDTDGKGIEGALVTVVIYTETEERENVDGKMINVTRRDYANITGVTNETGFYLIEGIIPGTWNVTATASDYEGGRARSTFKNSLIEQDIFLSPITEYYKITGSVVPLNASVELPGYTVINDPATGIFQTNRILVNGNYTLIIRAEGYQSFDEIVSVNGSDVDLDEIILDPEPSPPPDNHTVEIGPIEDSTDEPVEDATVTFTLNEKEYTTSTDEEGYAKIDISLPTMPEGTPITATKDDDSIIWTHGENIPQLGEGENNFLTRIMVILGICVLVFIIIVLVVLLRKRLE